MLHRPVHTEVQWQGGASHHGPRDAEAQDDNGSWTHETILSGDLDGNDLQDLLHVICKDGYEHHVAMNPAHKRRILFTPLLSVMLY